VKWGEAELLELRNLVHTKARRHEGLAAVNDSFAALFKTGGAAIDEKAQRKIEQSKIGENLLGVNRRQAFNGFQLNQNKTLDNQISPKSLLETAAGITDRNRLLAFDLEPLFFQQLR
jgi:hypothetical protein